jgi:patatin-like phospholipase/acyl hydrolase
MVNNISDFKVLSLDGGGSKGVFTLGVLSEVEAALGKPLCDEFKLVYGTSTGAIITALIALGKSMSEIKTLYFEMIPDIMGHKTRKGRSKTLRKYAEQLFSDIRFADFKTDVGIVATRVDYARPMIFKSSVSQAHGRLETFEPGFGASVSDALIASCAALPYFSKVRIETKNHGNPELLDGGFIGNNPTLFAITDALKAYKVPIGSVKALSIGVGVYREPLRRPWYQLAMNWWPFWLIRKTLDCRTNTNEIVRNMLLGHISCVRVDKTCVEEGYETDLLESNVDMLNKLFLLGRDSYAEKEHEIKGLLGL